MIYKAPAGDVRNDGKPSKKHSDEKKRRAEEVWSREKTFGLKSSLAIGATTRGWGLVY